MLINLYENIGGKIKGLAMVMFILEAIGAIITGVVLLIIDEDFVLAGLLTLFCGPIVAWVGSWILYAFGEFVEDIHAMRKKYYPIAEEQANRKAEEKAKRETEESAKHEVEEPNSLNSNSNVPLEELNKESTNQIKDDNFIHIQCKSCKKEFSFQKDMRKVRCPWCNAKQD